MSQPRAAVVGGGIAGLTAAWELARSGAEVELFEATDRLGGSIAPVALAGIKADAGAEAFATRTPAVRDFLSELGLAERIVSPNPAGAWLQLPELAAPLPATGIMGIPGDPEAADVLALLGPEAARRAAEDLTAEMTWTPGQTPTLGEVVADRMGCAVVDRLVAPITTGVHSAGPHQLSIRTAHPKLYDRMLEEGSLARAVAGIRASAPAGSAVQSLTGGMNTLVTALEEQLAELGARIHLDRPLHRSDSHFLWEGDYDVVVLALDAAQAAQLIGGDEQPVQQAPPAAQTGTGVALVSLLVHAPELDSHPRGTGMLVAPQVTDIRAKAMTHISAKWSWAAEALQENLGSSHHLLRLSYGRAGETGGLGFDSTDEQLHAAALTDLPRLTGTSISPERVLDHTVVRWRRGAASEAARSLRESLATSAQTGTRIAVVGESYAGTGLAQIIPDAREVIQSLLK